MDPGLAAIIGATLGGALTLGTTWTSQYRQERADARRRQVTLSVEVLTQCERLETETTWQRVSSDRGEEHRVRELDAILQSVNRAGYELVILCDAQTGMIVNQILATNHRLVLTTLPGTSDEDWHAIIEHGRGLRRELASRIAGQPSLTSANPYTTTAEPQRPWWKRR